MRYLLNGNKKRNFTCCSKDGGVAPERSLVEDCGYYQTRISPNEEEGFVTASAKGALSDVKGVGHRSELSSCKSLRRRREVIPRRRLPRQLKVQIRKFLRVIFSCTRYTVSFHRQTDDLLLTQTVVRRASYVGVSANSKKYISRGTLVILSTFFASAVANKTKNLYLERYYPHIIFMSYSLQDVQSR